MNAPPPRFMLLIRLISYAPSAPQSRPSVVDMRSFFPSSACCSLVWYKNKFAFGFIYPSDSPRAFSVFSVCSTFSEHVKCVDFCSRAFCVSLSKSRANLRSHPFTCFRLRFFRVSPLLAFAFFARPVSKKKSTFYVNVSLKFKSRM